MTFLLRTLSLSYVRRHLAKTLLTLLGVVVGVATFSAIMSAQETLVREIRSTVDRIAGKAHLQITMAGGLPEEVQETIRNLPGIRASSPVIEQIVSPQQGELGSLLLIGIDLLGDREMRDYSFDGDDADLDDPLLFLAQPDSAVFTRQFAAKAGISQGDAVTLLLPKGERAVTARGFLTPKGFSEAFGGNLMMMDVYAAQDLFGRGRHFDRLDVRLDQDTSVAQGITTLQQALGPAFQVETPENRGSQKERIIANFTAGFTLSSGFAIAIGTFLIFNAFNVAVNRRRRDIGTLRALGATPRQVQGLFLAEALVIGLVGGMLGCLVGATMSQGFLQVMGQTTEKIYGLTSAATVHLPPGIALRSILLGLTASLIGAWGPARVAARISPTEAFAKGVFQARLGGSQTPRLVLGALLLTGAIVLNLFRPWSGVPFITAVLLPGGVGGLLLVAPLARLLLGWLVPPISRLAPVAGRLAGNALQGSPRRSAGTLLAMTLSLTFVLGLGGYMGSSKSAMQRWMDNALTCDLFVRASASFARPDFLFPGSLRQELLQIPGVGRVESYRATHPMYQGRQILVGSIEIVPLLDRIQYDYLQGSADTLRRGAPQGQCLVSDNFASLFGLGVGQEVELATPRGTVRFPIAAVVRDYGSDQGTVLLDRDIFLRYWQDDRVDIYDVTVEPGADVGQVRDTIRARLAGRLPALVSTRQEFTAEINQAIDAFYALTRITILLALVVALLGIVTALLISVTERTREIGILKALGALPAQLARGVVLEALLMALVGLILSIPAGTLFAHFMEGPIAEHFTGWVMPHRYPWDVLIQLLIALPLVSVLAAWLPARQAMRLSINEAIGYE
ncbi:MAG: ABC transporter permease [Desulfobulbaceae bacterium A2]|nr:MAG: ABC transporter permease [Desulfobulbaceae bacterium A2]